MGNLRNNREYREAVLTALGMTEDRDVENGVNFKSALLEALGVEHTRSDVVNFETYREKLVEGVENYSGGGGSSDFTIKTIVKNITTGEIITSPDLNVEAQPSFYAYIVDGDEPYTFVLEDEGTISFCYQDYKTSSFIDTVTLKTIYPLHLQRFVVMLGEDELKIDSGLFNSTAIDAFNGFNIEDDGTLILLVKMLH